MALAYTFLGRIKAAIWEKDGESYSVTFARTYVDDAGNEKGSRY